MKRVEVRRDGVVLSCLDGGLGDGIVLLHGLAGSGQEMLPTAEALLPDHHVIAIDQRGHSHSTRRPEDLSRRAYVEDVVAVVEELANGAPVTVVGQSMGGHTAMLFAAWHPHLVHRLVLLEAGVGGGGAQDDYPARLGDWFASWPVPFADLSSAAEFLGSTPIARSWLRDLDRRTDGLWPRFEPDVMRAAIAAVADRARWDEWQQVKVPTLLVQGQNGTIPAAEVQQMLSLRSDVMHIVIPDAGHDAHLEQRDAWVRALRTFLGSPSPRHLHSAAADDRRVVGGDTVMDLGLPDPADDLAGPVGPE
ncbi:alpha/beta hydrolase [Micromonospora maris]|uniref:alpha/beta fold hydrolase n=1 Tax=Micromonospora maris TaxID=1003110 RepID=UPI002E11CC24|nr:alpha/beta hydrolase [Micromonospora maris]